MPSNPPPFSVDSNIIGIRRSGPPPSKKGWWSPFFRRFWAITLIAILGLGVVAYRLNSEPTPCGAVAFWIPLLITYASLWSGVIPPSNILFTIVPLIAAALLTLLPASKTITGSIIKSITILLLLLAVILLGWWFWILLLAPIFYVIGIIVGLIADCARIRKNPRRIWVMEVR